MQAYLAIACALFGVSCKEPAKEASDKTSAQATKSVDEMTKGATKDRKPTGTPRPQSKLTVTHDGKVVPMATALAWKDWDGTVRVTASSVPVGCDEVTGDSRWMHDGEVTFHVSIASTLKPDGSLKPQLRSTYFDGMSAQFPNDVTATGDGSPGQPTTVDVEFETTSAGSTKHTLAVKGTIDALGCPVPPRKDAPPAAAPMAATIEIAGNKLPIRFARFREGDWPSVTLYTGAEGCTQVAFQAPSEFQVELTWFKKEEPAVSQVTLSGSLIGNAADQTFDKKKLVVTPLPTGAGDLEIKGDIKVMDYPVKLDGKVTLTVCPKT